MISSKSLEGASEASSPGVARTCSTSLSIGRPNASFPVWSTAQRLAPDFAAFSTRQELLDVRPQHQVET